MDKKFIKVLFEEGTPLAELPEGVALKKLNDEVMRVYIMNGLHRGLQPNEFAEEVRICTAALYGELTTDPSYRMIRDKEIPYIFSNGMKGRLGTDKDINLTYKNLLRWVEGYVKHQERREAVDMIAEERKPKPVQLPPHEMTDDDYKRMVGNAWTDYREFKEAQKKRQESEPERKTDSRGPRSIEEIMGGVPLSCMDYGKQRISYLRRKGFASETESLLDVFDRAYRNGGMFERVG